MSLSIVSTNRLPTRPRVVIADDGPLVRALFRRILERSTEAIIVAEAADGQEAIEAVGAHQPDLLLLDIAMPNTDGLSAIPEIRRRSPATRVVLLSGFEGWQLDREATVHAADGYIEKQLDSDALIAKLREACDAAVAESVSAATARAGLGLTVPALDEPEAAQSARLFRLASLAAHDLRTPIQLIDGFARLLAENYNEVLDDAGGEFVSWILDAAASLDRMVSDMLELALVDAAEPSWSTVDLAELFASVRSRLAPVLDRTRVSLSWEPLPSVVADAEDMRRLFGHLLTNAITFVGPQPWVHVDAERGADGWTISVTDNGIGVPEHEATAIFDGLHRLHGKDTYPGTGVGLAVCKRLVERRGGAIGVLPGKDGGSRFWFTIPDNVP